MNFLTHSNLEGKHAFLGASNYHWLGYDDEKLINSWTTAQARAKGTRLHAFAAECIELRQKLPDKPQKTLSMYVNDAIGYKMTPEQILYYSSNCFGTADAISFRNEKLRIHDLKTGQIEPKMEQLLIYAALFFLEYDIKPAEVETELRLYWSNDIIIFKPELDDIAPVIDKIVSFDKLINELKLQEGE